MPDEFTRETAGEKANTEDLEENKGEFGMFLAISLTRCTGTPG